MTDQSSTRFTGALAILTSLFFAWGFLTCLNDILIPHLKAVFTLNYTQAMLVQFCFFSAYMIVSAPSGFLVDKIGYQNGIVVGLAIAASGCLLFYPAAELASYPLFLSALFVLASGITLLQVSANPYVTLLGNANTSASRLTMTQAFNALGTTVAPAFGALFILGVATKSADELQKLSAVQLSAYQTAQAESVQIPYLFLSAVLCVLAIIFAFLKLPQIAKDNLTQNANKQHGAWHYPHLVLGAVGIFLYVGAEVSIGSFLVSFLVETAELAQQQAAGMVSFYWGGAMVGRFVGFAILRAYPPGKVLAVYAGGAAILVLTTILGNDTWVIWPLLAVGFCNSIMFPSLFSLALKDLGEHTGQASGILCTAIVGGAILPILQGVLADNFGLRLAFILPFLCYGYIVYYGWQGARVLPKQQ